MKNKKKLQITREWEKSSTKDVIHNNSPGKRYFSRFYCCLCLVGTCLGCKCVLAIFRYSFLDSFGFALCFEYCFAKVFFEVYPQKRLQFTRSDSGSRLCFSCRFAVFSFLLLWLLLLLKAPPKKTSYSKIRFTRLCVCVLCCGWWLSVYKFWLDLLVYFIHKYTMFRSEAFNLHDLLQTLKLATTLVFLLGGNVMNNDQLHLHLYVRNPNYLWLNAMTHKHIQIEFFSVLFSVLRS